MTRYDSLLLRIWRREGVEGERWVSQVEHVQDGRVLRFSDREALLAYLWLMVGSQEQSSPGTANPTDDAFQAGSPLPPGRDG